VTFCVIVRLIHTLTYLLADHKTVVQTVVHIYRTLYSISNYFPKSIILTLFDLLYRQKRQAIHHPTEQAEFLVCLVQI